MDQRMEESSNSIYPTEKENILFLSLFLISFYFPMKKAGAFFATCSLFIILHFPIQSLLPMHRTGKNPLNKGALGVYGF